MAALERISVHGFRSIESIKDLTLAPLNVLIGANGAGKSNFVEVFSFLQAVREGRLVDYVARAGGADRVLHFGARKTPQLSIHLVFSREVNQYSITLEPTDEDGLYPADEKALFWDKQYPRPYSQSLNPTGTEAGISRPADGVQGYVRDHLKRWRLYHFHDTSSASPMKRTGDVADNRFLREDGSNLAAFLFRLKATNPGEYNLIRGTVRRVAPFFDDFSLEPSALNEEKIKLEWKHEGTDAYFGGSSLSDGSLRFIALATLLLQPTSLRPSVVMVDEPELGLHPYALTVLASMFKAAAAQGTQVLIATQSSLLLDHFDPEDILVANRRGGGTVIERLQQEGLDEWLEDYSLGQLWEKNEIGGRPAAEGAVK